jgi:phenylpropionate dioxygenase-like ring-hydroxylating dioxygenase large terminal subunit
MNGLNSKYPKLLTHKDVFNNRNFFGSSHYVISKKLEMFSNRCPHRGNKIIPPGNCKDTFTCGLHGWSWSDAGEPANNNVNLRPRSVNVGHSGLVFLDWEEPSGTKWAKDLAQDQFEYSHSVKKHGEGDWRWQMEMHVDLLHVSKIHPLLDSYVDVGKLTTEYGSDWIAQHHDHGWWLFVYPFTHIEYEQGCLYFSEMAPRETGQGYDVYIHYLYNTSINTKTRKNFEHIAETTFDEDIQAVNELSAVSKYRAPSNAPHPLEQDIVHFYNWVEENTE